MTATDPFQPFTILEFMRPYRLTFILIFSLIVGGCSIDTDARREHWTAEAADFFSEQRDLDDMRQWLDATSSDAQLTKLGASDSTVAGTYVVTLEDLGDNWVCRYWVVLDASVDAASMVTDHEVDVHSACL